MTNTPYQAAQATEPKLDTLRGILRDVVMLAVAFAAAAATFLYLVAR